MDRLLPFYVARADNFVALIIGTTIATVGNALVLAGLAAGVAFGVKVVM